MAHSDLPGVKKYAPRDNFLNDLKPTHWLVAFAVLGLVLRLVFLKYRFAVAFDEVNYIKLGVSASQNGWGELLHTYWSPLLPTLIKLFCGLFRDYELAARLVSVVAGILVLVPLYKLGVEVFDRRIGLVAAGFVAFFPPIAFRDTQILTESVVILLVAWAVLYGIRSLKRHSVVNAFLAGLFSGLAYLAHPIALGLVVVLIAWILLGGLTRLFLITRLRLIYLVPATCIGFLSVSAPYLLFLREATGTWTFSAKAAANQQMSTPTHSKQDSFRSLNASNTSVPIDQVFHLGTFLQATDGQGQAVRRVTIRPFLVKFIKNFADVLRSAVPQFLTTLPLMLFGVGLFGATWEARQWKILLMLLSIVVFFWMILVPAFHIHQRYLAPVWPICALFIARGTVTVYEWLCCYLPMTRLANRWGRHPASLAGTLVLSVVTIVSFLPELGRVIAKSPVSREYVADSVEQKRAGAWLRTHTETTPVIMSRNHAVDFYAGNYDIKQSVTIPTSDLDRVLAYARHRQVTHLVLNERYVSDYPQLAFLLDGQRSAEDLRMVYQDVDGAGLKTVIYELVEGAN